MGGRTAYKGKAQSRELEGTGRRLGRLGSLRLLRLLSEHMPGDFRLRAPTLGKPDLCKNKPPNAGLEHIADSIMD